jgi:hypothetical protein
VHLLAEQREQELHLVAHRAALDPVQRAVEQFDGRDGHGTSRYCECDGSDIQSPDHGASSFGSSEFGIWRAGLGRDQQHGDEDLPPCCCRLR